GTIVIAERALHRTATGTFRVWWTITIALAAFFLFDTAREWYELIYHDHLTVATNVFGSTFYSLVGLHASHVTVGLFFQLIVLIASLGGFRTESKFRRIMFLCWYWHFVDAVWVVVFLVVYVIGK